MQLHFANNFTLQHATCRLLLNNFTMPHGFILLILGTLLKRFQYNSLKPLQPETLLNLIFIPLNQTWSNLT